ncbi:MAG: BrnT family toxin [Spirochaetales bacterium]|nr:BrnT family toxin [Spirochaetales bacterium]
MEFEWDERKNKMNISKHKVSFFEAQDAFFDANRLIRKDVKHSDSEERFFCFGKVNGMVCTVRFTMRGNKIRIIGAGYWRYGRQLYEEQNEL